MPFTYCLTFRLADGVGDKPTYADRYEALMDNVQKARSGGYWVETTSFVLFESDLSTGNLCAALSKGLNAKKDMIAVFDPCDMSSAYFGDMETPEVFASFFKSAKKVG